MKRIALNFVIIAVLVLIAVQFTSCRNKKSGNVKSSESLSEMYGNAENNTNKTENSIANTDYDNYSEWDNDKDDDLFLWDNKITVQILNDEVIYEQGVFIEYFDEEALGNQRIVFTTNVELSDFRYTAIQLDFTQAAIHIIEHDVKFRINRFNPEYPFVVNWRDVGTKPHAGISFTDENDVRRYFAIVANNAEPEEDNRGAILLIEYPHVDRNGNEPIQWSGGKLLESKTTNDGTSNEMIRFEYDNKQRIVKMFHYKDEALDNTKTVSYNGDELVKVVETDKETYFKRKGNIITLDNHSNYKELITINRNGFITKTETIYDEHDTSGTANPSIAYYYRGGNLNEAKGLSGPFWMSTEYVVFFKFDNKKTPFNCKTPRWFLQYYLGTETGLKNNVTKINFSSHQVGQTNSLIYEFDSDGFPAKITETIITDGEYDYAETFSTSFKYFGE